MKIRISTLAITFLCLIGYLTANAAMKTPDFAFPQTVEKNASADLAAAVKSHDAHAAANALIRSYLANAIIDPESRQASIRLAEQTAQEFKNSDLHGIFDALLAKMYSGMYEANRWTYDRRDTPFYPYPADLTEWNGKQFRQTIDSLCRASYANASALNALKIGDYSDIIEADKLTAIYYPTLLDFAYQNAIALMSTSDPQGTIKICDLGIEHASNDAARMQWVERKLACAGMRYDDFKKYNDAYGQNEFFDIVLNAYASSLYYPVAEEEADTYSDNGSGRTDSSTAEKIRQIKEAVDLITAFCAKYPASPLLANLANDKQRLLQPRLNTTAPRYISPGAEFDVNIQSQNASKATLKIYRIPAGQSADYAKVASLSPCRTINVDIEGTEPFVSVKKVRVALTEPGRYAIVATTPGGKVNSGCNTVNCIVALPIAVYSNNEGYIEVTHPETGAPMPGVEVLLTKQTYRKNAPAPQSAGVTDSNGCVKFKCAEPSGYAISLKVDGKTHEYGNLNIWLNKPGERSDTAMHATILTDRSIYHPGDSVHVLAVVQQTCNSARQASSVAKSAVNTTIIFKNANGQEVASATGTTDDFGRYSCSFAAPADGLTGRYSLEVKTGGDMKYSGSASVTVADYRMPDFEITLEKPARGIPRQGDVTISGHAVAYSGAPMANTEITATVREASFWRWFRSGSMPFFSASAVTDAQGNFSITVPDSAMAAHRDTGVYQFTADGVSSSGSTASASTTFAQGLRYEIMIQSLDNSNINGELPYAPKVAVIGPDGENASIALKWRLQKAGKTMHEGDFTGSIDLSGVAPATYTFTIAPADTALASPASMLICVYNRKSGKAPADTPLWVLAPSVTTDGGNKAQIEYATIFDDAYVYYSYCGSAFMPIDHKKVNAGYHTLTVDAPAPVAPGNIVIAVVRDCNTYTQQISLTPPPAGSLAIESESFRDNLMPGRSETWKLRVKNSDGSGVNSAVVLDMWNKALSAIEPHSLSLASYARAYARPLSLSAVFNHNISNSFEASIKPVSEQQLVAPQFNFYGVTPGWGGRMIPKARVAMKNAVFMSADAVTEEVAVNDLAMASSAPAQDAGTMGAAEAEEALEEGAMVKPEADAYRSDDVPLAIWEPMLSTDSEGNLCYTFTVPDANTTWQLQALAWNADMRIGSLMREFVASKPIMVMPNAPKYLREGDQCTISTIILNHTDSACMAKVTAEIFNPLNGSVMKSYTETIDIAPNASATVATPVAATSDVAAIGFRIKAVTMHSGPNYSDGEQSAIRIMPSMASLVETEPFYLNPGETTYATTLPKQKDARITLSFCENPAWTIVSALPGLRDSECSTANSAAAAIFSAAISRGIVADNPEIGRAVEHWLSNKADSTLASMLEKNEDLKIAMLNATPWVCNAQNDTERMARLSLIFDNKANVDAISRAVAVLGKLQNADGGWAWGSWDSKSSQWVTANVLGMMAQLRQLGWMPADKRLEQMTSQAVGYYDQCMQSALQRAERKEKVTDMLYALMRPQFAEIAIPQAGKTVIANTVNYISANWKSMADPADKAIAAAVLYRNNYSSLSMQLMKSISEFGVWSKDQGLKFPSVNALYDYSILLESYSLIEPGSKEVDGLRQQLIVRKQGNDWGNAVVTSQTVAAILGSGSRWTVPASGATIKAGNDVIEANAPVDKYTGSLEANISRYAGKKLTINTSGAGPAYGAVFSQFKQTMDDVKASACDDLSIEKTVTVRRGTEWVYAPAAFKVGDRVKVQLTIHCNRNLQYVAIVDERPAAFQPVEQVPGWIYSEGLGFYRENRDAVTNLYVSSMAPGTYVITYEMNVGMAGSYSSGVASIQSQYAPEISAHSAGCKITVSPK